MGIDSQLSVSFLMSRPAAELLSVFLLANHRAYISSSLSACDPRPERKSVYLMLTWTNVSRGDGMSLSSASTTTCQ